ncbi:hypothetical protein [Tenacibaculum finnmarkense]|uniref:hypothetical protein n=1 Tax=Tenacibaculum finnmarkense TaxID=2781243 RepID=UPI001EFBA54A|nr:hypothetical protein [Tenacibaculum finnmarkense]
MNNLFFGYIFDKSERIIQVSLIPSLLGVKAFVILTSSIIFTVALAVLLQVFEFTV